MSNDEKIRNWKLDFRNLRSNFKKSLLGSQHGQTLVIMLLVMAISLGVGLAVSSRSISTLRQTTFTEQGSQALGCAEAGAEEALQKITDDDISDAGDTPLLNEAGDTICTYSYTIGDLVSPYEFDVAQDTSQQIDLDGFTGSLTLNWDKTGSNANAMISVVYFEGDEYKIQKDAYYCGVDRQNGFTQAGGGSASGYNCSANVSVPAGAKLARIKLLYASDTILVEPSGDNFPLQGYKITSAGKAGQSTRILEVTRTKAQMPAIFDYAIYSGSGLSK